MRITAKRAAIVYALIAAFLAVLELAKNKTIYVSGDGEDIQIELLEGNENS